MSDEKITVRSDINLKRCLVIDDEEYELRVKVDFGDTDKYKRGLLVKLTAGEKGFKEGGEILKEIYIVKEEALLKNCSNQIAQCDNVVNNILDYIDRYTSDFTFQIRLILKQSQTKYLNEIGKRMERTGWEIDE